MIGIETEHYYDLQSLKLSESDIVLLYSQFSFPECEFSLWMHILNFNCKQT